VLKKSKFIVDPISMRPSVTGRDRYIAEKALAYAIAAIDALPENRREQSDRDDMVLLLHAITSRTDRDHLRATIKFHMDREIDFQLPARTVRRGRVDPSDFVDRVFS
jgi:hypothetical protein